MVGARPGLPSPAIMLVTDRRRLHNRERTGDEALDDAVRDAVLGGVNIVQLREKDLATNDLIALGLHVRDAIARRALLFVNGNLAAARVLSADGVHLPIAGPSPSHVRDELGDRVLISAAAHTLDEARAAELAGADAVVLGTVFSTDTHPSGQTIGLQGVETVAAAVRIPIIAIGGISADNARACIEAGAAGVAVIGAIMDAPDPREATAALRTAIGTGDRKQ
jgi:thiamine-phosphate diphosphorylase